MSVELKEIILYTQDMNAEATFYRDILGLAVLEPQGIKDFRDFYEVKLQADSCVLVLQTNDAVPQDKNSSRLLFRVPDIERTRKELLTGGFEVIETQIPGQGIWICEGKDPAGHSFAIESSDKKTRSIIPRIPVPAIPTSPPSLSATSFMGRLITLLRTSKIAIAGEIILMAAIFYALQRFSVDLIFAMCVLVFFTLWLRGSNLGAIGLKRTPVIWVTLFLGIVAGIFIYIINIVFIDPLLAQLFNQSPNLIGFNPIQGNVLALISILLSVWTTTAIGEEFIFRGYLLNRLLDLCGTKAWGWILAISIQAILFGLAHSNQGIAGIFSTTIGGVFFGVLFLASRRNIWYGVIAHGTIDTIAILLIFFGR